VVWRDQPGPLPPEVVASQFGPNLVSLMAVLMGCYRMSKRQVVDVVGTCFGVPVAASSVVNQRPWQCFPPLPA
jgi:hypothetical protein